MDIRSIATDHHLRPHIGPWAGLADAVLVVHLMFVAFVVGGLAFIWIGAMCGWQVIRNFFFRVLHLAAILFVCAEALIGVACPLTVWEDELRGRPAETGFIARWCFTASSTATFPDGGS